MKISQDIRREYEDGMRMKSEEFAAAGNRVYLPIADSR
jgi:phosphomethylpyrimidine synthase